MRASENEDSERVLICAANRRDGELTSQLLERDGLVGKVCLTISDVCDAIAEGAGAALIAEDMLLGHHLCVKEFLLGQPPWSDFPFVIFGSAAERWRAGAKSPLLELGNVNLLDRSSESWLD